jgi:hypothetical protein
MGVSDLRKTSRSKSHRLIKAFKWVLVGQVLYTFTYGYMTTLVIGAASISIALLFHLYIKIINRILES